MYERKKDLEWTTRYPGFYWVRWVETNQWTVAEVESDGTVKIIGLELVPTAWGPLEWGEKIERGLPAERRISNEIRRQADFLASGYHRALERIAELSPKDEIRRAVTIAQDAIGRRTSGPGSNS